MKRLILKRHGQPVKELGETQFVHEVVNIQDKADLFDVETFVFENQIRQVFIDTETTGLDPFASDLVMIQLMAGNKVFLVNVDSIGTEPDTAFFYDGICQILQNPEVIKVFHNATFDLKILKEKLFKNDDPEVKGLFDTFIAEQLLTAGISKKGEHSLRYLAKKYANVELDKTFQTSFRTGKPLTSAQLAYAAQDVKVLQTVFQKQKKELNDAGLIKTALVEFDILPLVADIELNGMLLDQKKLQD